MSQPVRIRLLQQYFVAHLRCLLPDLLCIMRCIDSGVSFLLPLHLVWPTSGRCNGWCMIWGSTPGRKALLDVAHAWSTQGVEEVECAW